MNDQQLRDWLYQQNVIVDVYTPHCFSQYPYLEQLADLELFHSAHPWNIGELLSQIQGHGNVTITLVQHFGDCEPSVIAFAIISVGSARSTVIRFGVWEHVLQTDEGDAHPVEATLVWEIRERLHTAQHPVDWLPKKLLRDVGGVV